MSQLKITLFGFPQIAIDDTPLRLGRRKTLALLAYLTAGGPAPRLGASRTPFVASRDTLSTLLWVDFAQDQAASYLRQALWDFHKTAGEGWIHREGAAVGLAEGSDMWIDVGAFEDRLNAWKAGSRDDPAAVDLLREAAQLYQADFLEGFSLRDSPEFEAWQTLRAEGLRLALAEALETLSRLLCARGEYAEALVSARRWLALDELNEPAQREVMRLLSESGQRSAALNQYEACQRILQEELGIAPEPATIRLYEQISAQQPSTGGKAQTTERVLAPVFLPAQTTPFLGRKAELARIQELLAKDECRLITLLGPGGSGKTRLAIQAAGQSSGDPQGNHFPHGIYFAGLASASSEAETVRAIAGALRFDFRVDFGSTLKAEQARKQLLEYLAGKKILLVLDNLEQLVDCAGLFSEILATAPMVKLITTSRVRLNMPEEWVLEVGGLLTPDETGSGSTRGPLYPDHFEAVQLFLKSAERAGGFHPRAEDWPAITRIVRQVEGLPLGVELASAWVKMLSCQEIAAEMAHSLDFLETTLGGFPERQRSLRAVFEHSWRLLSERERSVFQRLSIFRSGFTREAAFEVAGASLRLLSAFTDKSLLRRVASGRFDLHEMVKQYAAEKLAADPASQADTEERHARHYASWLIRKGEGLKGSDQMAALSTMRWEKQNLRRAWNWLIDHQETAVLEQALPAVILFFEMDGDQTQARQMMHSVVRALHQASPPNTTGETNGLLGLSLAGIRYFERDANDPMHASSIQRESHDLARFLPPGQTRAYISMLLCSGSVMLDTEELLSMCQESIAIFESTNDVWGAALATLVQGDSINFRQGSAPLARQAYEKSLDLFTRLGNDWGRALCFFGLATLTAPAGQMEEACRLLQNSLDIYLRMGNMGRVLDTRHLLGEFFASLGQIDQARQYFTANQTYLEEVGAHERSKQTLERLARLDLNKPGNPQAR